MAPGHTAPPEELEYAREAGIFLYNINSKLIRRRVSLVLFSVKTEFCNAHGSQQRTAAVLFLSVFFHEIIDKIA